MSRQHAIVEPASSKDAQERIWDSFRRWGYLQASLDPLGDLPPVPLPELDTVLETAGLYDCIKVMQHAQVHRMPVVDAHGKAVGIVSFGDLLAILSKELATLTSTVIPRESRSTGWVQFSQSAA